MRPKMLVLMGSLVASLLAMGLAAAPAFGQEAVEAKASDDVVARAPTTPALEELPPFANTGNVQPIPDLEPLPGFFPAPTGGFDETLCVPDVRGNLLVRVGNQQGFGPAPQSTTELRFVFDDDSSTVHEEGTPPIPAGGAIVLPVDLPNRAIDEPYWVAISVDSREQVGELNEGNNYVSNFGSVGCPPAS